MKYIKCEDCPLDKAHALLRDVDPTIIGCDYYLVKDPGRTQVVHRVKQKGESHEERRSN